MGTNGPSRFWNGRVNYASCCSTVESWDDWLRLVASFFGMAVKSPSTTSIAIAGDLWRDQC